MSERGDRCLCPEGLGGGDGALCGGLRLGRLVVFSIEDVVAQGIVALLPAAWHSRVRVVASVDALARALGRPRCVVIVDYATPGSVQALGVVGAAQAVVVLAAGGQALDGQLLAVADAVLLRDQVDRSLLAVALLARRMGVRLLPSVAVAAGGGLDGDAGALPAVAWRALQLLADGLHDSEIARELHMSQSAVRKQLQRAMRMIGARTRCQAVAWAIANGKVA